MGANGCVGLNLCSYPIGGNVKNDQYYFETPSSTTHAPHKGGGWGVGLATMTARSSIQIRMLWNKQQSMEYLGLDVRIVHFNNIDSKYMELERQTMVSHHN